MRPACDRGVMRPDAAGLPTRHARILFGLAAGFLALCCSRPQEPGPSSSTPPPEPAVAGTTVSLDAPEEHLTGVIAEVNGRRLYRALYERSLSFIRDRLAAGRDQAQVESYINARVDALNRIVNDELIAQQAEKEGRAPTDDEVRAEYARLVAAAGDEAVLLKKLRSEQTTKWEAIDAIRRRLAVDRFVTERVTPIQTVSEEETVSYYNNNIIRFTPELWVKLYQILIRCPRGASPDRVEAARKRAVKILANLRAGTPFEQMAREFSEDPDTARMGGSFGFVKQGALPEMLDAVAFSIALNEASDIVRSDEGFHILKVTERHGGTPKPYAEVKERCQKAVLTMKQAGAIEDLANQLRETAKIETYLTPQQ
ncbi:MAG TPA: peptidylprolyl isomerase [Candidatus Polarisedimenticolia bacterium]